MDSLIGRTSHLSLRLLILFVFLAPSALAQQPQSQPPASTPQAQPPNPAQSQQDKDKDKPKDTGNDQKTDDDIGKSKLERETGTINDRIFEVLPNYGTVETAKSVPPLSAKQKFQLATASVFDWGAYPFNGALAAIDQAKDDPKSWGQGWAAYGKRFGSSFADNSIGTYMTAAIFPSLLHEDPRYYQMGKGGFTRRAYHGLNRLFVTRNDKGQDQFNYSESIGNAVAAALSNVYHAPEDRTASRNAVTFVFLIIYDGLNNELKEFWPDIRRKVLHKDTP
jgi:hypothetical protein